MIPAVPGLWAAAPASAASSAAAGEGVMRTTFEWGRIQSNSDWILPVIVCLAIMLFVRYLYRRDAEELPRPVSWLLTALRTATFYGLLVLYLEPQWRNEQEVTRNSRVLVLADTSLSMSLTDVGPADSANPLSRAGQVAGLLEHTDFLAQLRRTHDVVVARFDQELAWVATLPKLSPQAPATAGETPADEQPIAWPKVLAPTGPETRLGQTLRQLIVEEQHAPLAGVVLLSDGGQNAGVAPEAAIQAARDAKVPVFPIGIGSDRLPANVRVSDLAAPPQAYPGDRYTVTGYLQAQRMAGRTVTVELLSRPLETGGNAAAQPDKVEATQQVTLGGDGEVMPVKFELTPEALGHRMLTLRVKGAGVDPKADDSQREVDVNVVDRKNRVLLLAGGPHREYSFLRGLLYRDKSMTLDLLLQSAKPGISQEANKILDEFPSTPQELFAYDCLVALDPDWQQLSAAQLDLLERWVGKEGGGLIVEPGQIYAGRTVNGWVQDPAMEIIRRLYPVEFQRSVAMLDSQTYSSKEPWALDLTREGLEAEFLWLEDTAPASQQTWAGFPGVFSYYPVRGPKPGATVYARFTDPRTGQAGKQPVYFASQFYGSGRVFYLGSPEMWRLRRMDESYFEKFYTKLIRYVSQGRLLRGSSRGVLLVGQDRGYMVGQTVEIRAQLSNAQHEPLKAPGVTLQVSQREGAPQTVTLQPDAGRPGTFAGRFTALREGAYRLDLSIPDGGGERLVRYVQVEMPRAERKDPQRNDALLARIAQHTGGKYYVGPELALSAGTPDALAGQLKDKTRTIILTAAMDKAWEETWLRWTMYVLVGLLAGEWLIRRLYKLA